MVNQIKSFTDVCLKLTRVLNNRQKILAIFVLLLSLINAIFQVLGVSIIVPLTSAMISPEEMMNNRYAIWICDKLEITQASSLFTLIILATIALYIIKNMFCIFQSWVSTKYSFKIQRELSLRVMKTYMNRSYDFFLGYGTAQIMRDVKSDPEGVNAVIILLFSMITEIFTMAMILVYIIVMDWKMAACIALLAYLCIGLFYKGFKNMAKKAGIKNRSATTYTQKILLESIEGVKEVQVMKKQNFFIGEYERALKNEQEPQIIERMISVCPTYVIEGTFVTGIMAYLYFRLKISIDNELAVPMLASFVMGAVRMLPSLGRISSYLTTLQYRLPSLNSVYETINRLHNDDNSYSISEAIDSGENIVFNDSLQIKDIEWKYADSDRMVLEGLNISVKKGQSIGIIGKSGAGKSTLVDVLLGLHIPQSGSVLIDGRDIYSIPFEYSRVVSYVPQTTYLIDGTIKENVAFGVASDAIEDDMIWEALEKAQLAEFTKKETENGLDTVVGERGVKMSGGQRQRLAIARALYRRPQIIVLDEATSALDNETEAAVMEAIEGLYGSVTVIIIAHRLTTVRKCDVIYEIDKGKAKKIDKEALFAN